MKKYIENININLGSDKNERSIKMYRCGKPEKSYFSKAFGWFVWVVPYKKEPCGIIYSKVFNKKQKKEAYNFYETLKEA